MLDVFDGAPFQYDGLRVGRIGDSLVFRHSPMEPTHEEQAKRQPVRAQNHVRILGKSPGIDVANHMVRKHRDSIVHIGAALTVLEPIKESSESVTFLLFRLFRLVVLKVSEILLS